MVENRTSHQMAIAWSDFKTYAPKSAGLPACLVDFVCSQLCCLFCFCLDFLFGADFCQLTGVALHHLRFVLTFPALRSAGFSSARASLNTGLVLNMLLSFPWVFPPFLCLPSICSVVSYIQYLSHLLLCRTPLQSFTRINFSIYGLFQNPGLPTCFSSFFLGLNKNNVFCVKPVFYTTCSFTQKKKRVYTQKPCFLQKQCSCWACSNPVCCLQNSSFHGGRRNTPKAVQLDLE